MFDSQQLSGQFQVISSPSCLRIMDWIITVLLCLQYRKPILQWEAVGRWQFPSMMYPPPTNKNMTGIPVMSYVVIQCQRLSPTAHGPHLPLRLEILYSNTQSGWLLIMNVMCRASEFWWDVLSMAVHADVKDTHIFHPTIYIPHHVPGYILWYVHVTYQVHM